MASCLDSPVRGNTFMKSKIVLLKKADPNPHTEYARKIYLWKEVLSTEELTHLNRKLSFYTP